MSNNPDDKAQGLGGEGKRPYATIDLKATQIDEKPVSDTTGSGPKPEAATSKPADKPEDLGPGTAERKPDAPAKTSAVGLVTHLAAGLVGAVVVLGISELALSDREEVSRQASVVRQLTSRIAELEGAVGGRPGADGMRARLDDLARNYTRLNDAQSKLAADTRALDTRVGGQDIPQGLAERLTKMDEILATVPTPAGREPSPAAKTLLTRVDGELSALRTETGRLSQRIDTLRGEVDERLKGAARASDVTPLTAKMAAMEKDVQTFTRSEADRNANASRIVLLLELGNLKRALDTGKRYPSELAAVEKVAGGKLNLAPLQRYVMDGVPPVSELQKSFRRVANTMLDAEAEPNNATLVDRLVNGAKSVVRVRKQGHAADDTSAEATVGRMEAALKESRLAEVLAQGKKLPPKAVLAGEDWLKKVEARQAVDGAITDIEQTLKTSLGEAQR